MSAESDIKVEHYFCLEGFESRSTYPYIPGFRYTLKRDRILMVSSMPEGAPIEKEKYLGVFPGEQANVMYETWQRLKEPLD